MSEINPTTKEQIDKMTLNRMRRMMRKLPIDAKIFLGETGYYFSKILREKEQNELNQKKFSNGKNKI